MNTNVNKQTFGKVVTTNLMKKFDSFEDGYAEVIKLNPEIKAYCGDTILHDAVVNSILNTVRDNIPSVNNTNYPNTLSFSIDSHEVGLKTDSNMAFGWRVVFDRETGKAIYKFRVAFITVPMYRKPILAAMKEAGWTVSEFTTQSRFWNSVEGKENRPRKDRYNNGYKKPFNKPVEENKQTETVIVEDSLTETEEIESSNPVNCAMAEAFARAEEEKNQSEV